MGILKIGDTTIAVEFVGGQNAGEIKARLIKELVKNKKVLDLGCVEHKLDSVYKNTWLHKNIRESAEYVLGVDILEKDVKELQKMGYNVICQNVEELKIDDKFDCVVCGDLIEHLLNFRGFFEGIKSVLKDNGMQIFTTPNPFGLYTIIKYIFRKLKINPEHTCWFSVDTLSQLLSKFGFKIEKIIFYGDTKSSIMRRLLRLLFGKYPYLDEHILVIAVKKWR